MDEVAFHIQYMSRVCVCGATRAQHAHFYEDPVKRIGLRVLAVQSANCPGFLDAIELELGGNPLANPTLTEVAQHNLSVARDQLERLCPSPLSFLIDRDIDLKVLGDKHHTMLNVVSSPGGWRLSCSSCRAAEGQRLYQDHHVAELYKARLFAQTETLDPCNVSSTASPA